MENNGCVLRMEEIGKQFPGVKALDNVTFPVKAGEVHALVGENGAGKSTLMKILTGIIPKDNGRIILKDQEVHVDTPRTAQLLGISIIHQELATVPYLTVGQNIYLGREPRHKLGLIQWSQLYEKASVLLERLHLKIDPRMLMKDIPIAQQQMVEVAKAISFEADIIVMDEPTSSLTETETDTLFEIIRKLRTGGMAIIYISHRMEEIFELAERVTVLRDGQLVGTHNIDEVTRKDVINMMVGRELEETKAKTREQADEVVLEVKGLTRGKRFRNINLDLRRGEILGISGLVGAGRTEVARAIFGIDPFDEGSFWVQGQPANIRSPQDAIACGIGFVPEDRKEQGLFLGMTVQENITIGVLDQFSKFGFPNRHTLRQVAEEYVDKLNIRTPNLQQILRNLSGGNQQKVVIAKWLTHHPKILILDEPTRGIDVGAKMEIYRLIHQLAEQGVGILMISSELPEILRISDRIVVMCQGEITAQFSREEATQDAIMHYAVGGH